MKYVKPFINENLIKEGYQNRILVHTDEVARLYCSKYDYEVMEVIEYKDGTKDIIVALSIFNFAYYGDKVNNINNKIYKLDPIKINKKYTNKDFYNITFLLEDTTTNEVRRINKDIIINDYFVNHFGIDTTNILLEEYEDSLNN